jgi:predicted nucleic-acid-binding protein
VIGLDTNILLRLWLADDPAQNDRLDALLAEHGGVPGSLLVNDVVLAEALWTLRSAYNQDKAAQTLAVRSLLDEPAFAFQDRAVVEAALALFDASNCSFAECLIAVRNACLGCTFTTTLDRRMQRLAGVKVI